MAEKEKKIPKGYSLDPKNIEWVAAQALGQSTPKKKVSDSAYLDNILTELRIRKTVAVEIRKAARVQ